MRRAADAANVPPFSPAVILLRNPRFPELGEVMRILFPVKRVEAPSLSRDDYVARRIVESARISKEIHCVFSDALRCSVCVLLPMASVAFVPRPRELIEACLRMDRVRDNGGKQIGAVYVTLFF